MASQSQRLTTDEAPLHIGLAELDQAVRAADSAAILVPPRILRRVIKQDGRIGGIGLRVPHRKSYVIGREELLSIVELAELDLRPETELAEIVILIARPSAQRLASSKADEILTKYWRLLFHARIHFAFDGLMMDGRLGPAVVAQRIGQIGRTEFDEIRGVLGKENFLLPPQTDVGTYVEFAAVYFELRYFAPGLVGWYFPGIQNLGSVDTILREDVDADLLFGATRLAGAADPSSLVGAPNSEPVVVEPELPPQPSFLPSARMYQRLMERADQMELVRNPVGAALLRLRAVRYGQPEQARHSQAAARADVLQLADRLRAALGFPSSEGEEWSRALLAVLKQSSRATWTAEARLLYNLQKVCVDHERGLYALDLWGWAKALGRRPIKRPLPGQRDVLMAKHLRAAASRLSSTRLPPRARARLDALLQSAVHRAETSLRARFRPLIERILDEVKLTPRNLPERVARKKMVHELLDAIVDRGFLTMGDLRDALSRNNLKLPDLSNRKQLLWGDQLLQADRQLAIALNGVYRRGEIYLRVPQRLSSLAFGTPPGRFFTRHIALPFGGALLLLEAVNHLVTLTTYWFGPREFHMLPSWKAKNLGRAIRARVPWVLLLGAFIWGLIHQRAFRGACLNVIWWTGRFLRTIFVTGPAWLLRLPWIHAVINSAYFRLARRYMLKPLVLSGLIAVTCKLTGYPLTVEEYLGLFVVIDLLINSRLGRKLDEIITDWAVHTWERLQIHVFATLFRWIVEVFARLLVNVERLLYAVDEWLRFRAGENRFITGAKIVLGVVWLFVHYVIRFCINLLIEPQINPIKHFPVVTVSHKIIAPLLLRDLELYLVPFLGVWAPFASTAITLALPGIPGFLVWELKENWRLYAANRTPDLKPIMIGHHGEEMLQFMRPGFRSGTLPKLYAKLRHAGRKSLWTGNWKATGKHRDSLHRVEEHIRRFVDREFLALLAESPGWSAGLLTTGEIKLGTNCIEIELYCPRLAEDSLWLRFEERSGWLVASVAERGWLGLLTERQWQTLANALAGFYKMAGVHLVREQIETRLLPSGSTYDVREDGLVITTPTGASRLYMLHEGRPRAGDKPGERIERATDDPEPLVFAADPISWRRWVTTWDLDQFPQVAPFRVLEGVCLLPGDAAF